MYCIENKDWFNWGAVEGSANIRRTGTNTKAVLAETRMRRLQSCVYKVSAL